MTTERVSKSLEDVRLKRHFQPVGSGCFSAYLHDYYPHGAMNLFRVRDRALEYRRLWKMSQSLRIKDRYHSPADGTNLIANC